MVIAEETFAGGVYQLLGADAQELPLADGLDALYLCGGKTDAGV